VWTKNDSPSLEIKENLYPTKAPTMRRRSSAALPRASLPYGFDIIETDPAARISPPTEQPMFEIIPVGRRAGAPEMAVKLILVREALLRRR
jgi:hypothetical protein